MSVNYCAPTKPDMEKHNTTVFGSCTFLNLLAVFDFFFQDTHMQYIPDMSTTHLTRLADFELKKLQKLKICKLWSIQDELNYTKYC